MPPKRHPGRVLHDDDALRAMYNGHKNIIVQPTVDGHMFGQFRCIWTHLEMPVEAYAAGRVPNETSTRTAVHANITKEELAKRFYFPRVYDQTDETKTRPAPDNDVLGPDPVQFTQIWAWRGCYISLCGRAILSPGPGVPGVRNNYGTPNFHKKFDGSETNYSEWREYFIMDFLIKGKYCYDAEEAAKIRLNKLLSTPDWSPSEEECEGGIKTRKAQQAKRRRVGDESQLQTAKPAPAAYAALDNPDGDHADVEDEAEEGDDDDDDDDRDMTPGGSQTNGGTPPNTADNQGGNENYTGSEFSPNTASQVAAGASGGSQTDHIMQGAGSSWGGQGSGHSVQSVVTTPTPHVTAPQPTGPTDQPQMQQGMQGAGSSWGGQGSGPSVQSSGTTPTPHVTTHHPTPVPPRPTNPMHHHPPSNRQPNPMQQQQQPLNIHQQTSHTGPPVGAPPGMHIPAPLVGHGSGAGTSTAHPAHPHFNGPYGGWDLHHQYHPQQHQHHQYGGYENGLHGQGNVPSPNGQHHMGGIDHDASNGRQQITPSRPSAAPLARVGNGGHRSSMSGAFDGMSPSAPSIVRPVAQFVPPPDDGGAHLWDMGAPGSGTAAGGQERRLSEEEIKKLPVETRMMKYNVYFPREEVIKVLEAQGAPPYIMTCFNQTVLAMANIEKKLNKLVSEEDTFEKDFPKLYAALKEPIPCRTKLQAFNLDRYLCNNQAAMEQYKDFLVSLAKGVRKSEKKQQSLPNVVMGALICRFDCVVEFTGDRSKTVETSKVFQDVVVTRLRMSYDEIPCIKELYKSVLTDLATANIDPVNNADTTYQMAAFGQFFRQKRREVYEKCLKKPLPKNERAESDTVDDETWELVQDLGKELMKMDMRTYFRHEKMSAFKTQRLTFQKRHNIV